MLKEKDLPVLFVCAIGCVAAILLYNGAIASRNNKVKLSPDVEPTVRYVTNYVQVKTKVVLTITNLQYIECGENVVPLIPEKYHSLLTNYYPVKTWTNITQFSIRDE